MPRAVLGRGLPTLLHELPPAPGPLGELLRIRLLDACPLMQAVHEVAAQAVAIVDSLHGPLVVPDLGDRSALGGLGLWAAAHLPDPPGAGQPDPHCCPNSLRADQAPEGSSLSHLKGIPHHQLTSPRFHSAAGTYKQPSKLLNATWPVSMLWPVGQGGRQTSSGMAMMEGSEGFRAPRGTLTQTEGPGTAFQRR